jgi:general secretion pathway protein G
VNPAVTPSLHPVRILGFTLVELLFALAIVGILASLASTGYLHYVENSRNAVAMSDIRSIEQCIESYYLIMEELPPDLATAGCSRDDPWGHPYRYLDMANAKGKFRKDKNLHPLNSDYDLYSMGPDGKSVAPLTAKASRDDIIRANNGNFIGLAADY